MKPTQGGDANSSGKQPTSSTNKPHGTETSSERKRPKLSYTRSNVQRLIDEYNVNMDAIRKICNAHRPEDFAKTNLIARICDFYTAGTGNSLQPRERATSDTTIWLRTAMGATDVRVDLGARPNGLDPFRQRPSGCGVVAPYLATQLRNRDDWLTFDGLTEFAVAPEHCDEAADWLGFPGNLGSRHREEGGMVMLGNAEVQGLAVYHQNRDEIRQEVGEQRARWTDGSDWLQLPENGPRCDTAWLQIGSRDYVMRRIAERVRDAAQAIEAGLYRNPGVHVAIMNTRDSRSTGFHWVVVMYEIRGRGH